jgi:excisionase family DNA binding protein
VTTRTELFVVAAPAAFVAAMERRCKEAGASCVVLKALEASVAAAAIVEAQDADVGQLLIAADRAARALGVSPETFGRLVRDGEIPVVRVTPRTPRYRPEDLAAFIERRVAAEVAGDPRPGA